MTDAMMLEAFTAAMQHGPDLIVTVPAESFDEQREIARTARAWNAIHDAYTDAVLGWDECRDVTPEGCPHAVAEVSGLHVRFRFPASVGPEPVLAFADLVGPYAWPGRPRLSLEPAQPQGLNA